MTYRDPRLWVWPEAVGVAPRSGEAPAPRFYKLGALKAPCWEPSVDLYEADARLTLCVALPGVRRMSWKSSSNPEPSWCAASGRFRRTISRRPFIAWKSPTAGSSAHRAARGSIRAQSIGALEQGCLTLGLRSLGEQHGPGTR